jgi:hypothetical protein
MDRWIVFLHTSTAEFSGSSEATYPVIAVDSKACATLVTARLNHFLGVFDETQGGDYSNFTFKAESELTPDEFAMALDLKDPAFPGKGRYPDWLARTVSVARTATDEVRGGLANCVGTLLRAVEMHRLAFLFFAAARRRNPSAASTRSGVNERVLRHEIGGWSTMLEAIDADGKFLWAHRDVLDRYAQAALGKFGPGDGMQPTEVDENGNTIPVEGGTYPYWSLDDGSSKHLEETSDGILSACQALAEVERTGSVPDLVRAAIAASRPEGHSRWNESLVVNWSYLSTLDALVSQIKMTRVELPGSPESDNPSEGGPPGSSSVVRNVDVDRDPTIAPLTADHEAILAVLAKSATKCKTVIAVAGAGPIRNRETVGRLLRELAGFGLVNRPHGKRKGYALTPAGRKRLSNPNAAT